MTDTINVRVNAEDWKRVKYLALDNSVSAKEMLSRIIKEY